MSQIILRPVVHRDAYTRLVEREIVSWFREAVFAPLLIELFNASVPIDPKYQAIEFDEEGRVNEAAMAMYAKELGPLGVKRADMPQIPTDSITAVLSYLETCGVTHREEYLLPGAIKPTQEGYYPEAVERAKTFLDQPAGAFLVSKDFYLLDGHHRWTAALQARPAVPVRCLVFSRRVKPMLALLRTVPSTERANETTSAVQAALNSGRLHYAAGKFTGRFNAAISKELRGMGATFSPTQQTWSLAEQHLPDSIKAAVVESLAKSRTLHQQIAKTLAEIEVNVASSSMGLNFTRAVDQILVDAGRQFIQTTQTTANIAIPAEFTPAMRKQFTEELTQNTELYVKDFTVDMTRELRALVEKNGLEGMRTDKLARIIESKFGVSKRKAEFLADQETGLLMAKYREARYADLGVQEYVWSTSHDVRVREDHKKLDGRRFSFSHPPVTDHATGARNNPGEDFRCRCVPRPILNLATLSK